MPKVDDTQENEKICTKFCGQCPSYPGIKGEFLFCARGKSAFPKQETGCNCGSCGVWNKCGLNSYYYCIKGKAE